MNFPALQGHGQRWEAAGVAGASSSGTVVTANASANTKGTYAELIAATSFDAGGILVILSRAPGGSTAPVLCDIAIGAAASEQVLIPNLATDNSITGSLDPVYFFPISIPAGSRLSARSQSSTGSIAIQVTAYLVAGSFFMPGGLGRAEGCGPLTGTSLLTSIDGGATANTKGAYAQLIASTSFSYSAIVLGITRLNDSARTTCTWLFDLAVGASSSEQVIIPDLMLRCHSSNDEVGPCVIGPLPIDIPAGTRLSARTQCSTNVAGDRAFGLAAYGIG